MVANIHIKRKLILVGDSGVGKTSLIRKFVLDVFSDDYITTLGTKVSRKKMVYPDTNNGSNVELTLMIWDIMGQNTDELSPISAFYGTKGAIFVCDLTRKNTYNKLRHLCNEVLKISPNIPFIFVGNKIDLKNYMQVNEGDIGILAKRFNAPYYLTSAKSGENVEATFKDIGELMLIKQGIFN
jgi:small GTP-binding protein